jgi:hypothetical protein
MFYIWSDDSSKEPETMDKACNPNQCMNCKKVDNIHWLCAQALRQKRTPSPGR